jgi:hypothetical protein
MLAASSAFTRRLVLVEDGREVMAEKPAPQVGPLLLVSPMTLSEALCGSNDDESVPFQDKV